MIIIQGLGGPKEKPKGVSDGQPVNIPALRQFFLKVTKSSMQGGLSDFRLQFKVRQGLAGSFATAK